MVLTSASPASSAVFLITDVESNRRGRGGRRGAIYEDEESLT